jgi:hypothetical protein
MNNQSSNRKPSLKEAKDRLKKLQSQLVVAQRAEGINDHIVVKVTKNQARLEKMRVSGQPEKLVGKFFMQIDITAKKETVYVPLSIASGKTVTGFMYLIEGTSEGLITSATVDSRGAGVTQVTIGTLLFCKISPGTTASFRIQVSTRGKKGKTYHITIVRINYKLSVTDARYQQYLKPLTSKSVRLK